MGSSGRNERPGPLSICLVIPYSGPLEKVIGFRQYGGIHDYPPISAGD
jgi:hypothetical protein